ncbi:hypothetical protein [Gordonia sp. ABSL49_1]|uniref:hypothetical protein n=1 Tax=Gordonia sp. ABSL49_1 TaxID=2920941 RepID=UPI001F10A257|nr:hypothetical protein [Gordonia sp. ABSL49_1]MCH5645673.1 hypothetical protein [Gordonia sp. ABSL49_1]
MIDRDAFESLSELCDEMTCRPWDGTLAHLAELSCRQNEATEVLTAHADWMTTTKARVEASGEPWNTVSCRAQSRRDGDLAAPPEWIGELSERFTPEWKVR